LLALSQNLTYGFKKQSIQNENQDQELDYLNNNG
jgi:hypothetical protein